MGKFVNQCMISAKFTANPINTTDSLLTVHNCQESIMGGGGGGRVPIYVYRDSRGWGARMEGVFALPPLFCVQCYAHLIDLRVGYLGVHAWDMWGKWDTCKFLS